MSSSPLANPPPPRRAWQRLWPILAVVALAWLGVQLLSRAQDRPRPTDGPVPALRLTTFDGATVDLVALRGQGVVVNFWASWCIPCRAEKPLLEAAWQAEQGRGIVFIGVNHQDADAPARAFLAEMGTSYANGADVTGAWAATFGVVGLPTTFFISPEGEIARVIWGEIPTAAELARSLDAIRPAP